MKADLNKFKNRNVNVCGWNLYKGFSVFVPIVERTEGHSLLFEVRSENLNQQPREICFPGGKIENQEENAKAAVRETSEELLIPEYKIEVIGELDTLVTPFNTVIYPFTGILYDYKDTYNTDEVKEIFYVPVAHLMEAKPLCHYIDIEMKPREGFPYDMIQSGRNYPWAKGRYPVYFYTFEERIIWGITARIMHNFIEVLKHL
ncbi:MAG TPA: CoA pyrophosphatase [Clostridia bacterium]|nr:CoA pyrophosphatase [Clostridia bacterium]